MSKIEDFKNAPIGATATHIEGTRAMKLGDDAGSWFTPIGSYLDEEGMVFWGYTLDQSAPTTTREALDLAWELAHPVKEGQIIPGGSRFLEFYDTGVREYTAAFGLKITPELASITRTFDPLPDPKPDWTNAPAVIARHV